MGVRLGGNTSGISAVRLHGCANDLQLSQPFDGVGLFAPRSLSMVIAFTVQGNRATSHLQAHTLMPATCRCSFASVLPVAPPPKAIAVWRCRRGATSFVADNACGRGRVHRISISVVLGIPVSLQPSVELEVAHCAEFLLGRSRAEPESAQFRRVWSMDRTICASRRVVCIAALQQLIFNADRCALECIIRDQGQTTEVSFSSQNLTSILDKYVLEWMGEDAIDGLCFHPPKVQSYACFDLPMNRVGFPRLSRMIFAECESSKTPR